MLSLWGATAGARHHGAAPRGEAAAGRRRIGVDGGMLNRLVQHDAQQGPRAVTSGVLVVAMGTRVRDRSSRRRPTCATHDQGLGMRRRATGDGRGSGSGGRAFLASAVGDLRANGRWW